MTHVHDTDSLRARFRILIFTTGEVSRLIPHGWRRYGGGSVVNRVRELRLRAGITLRQLHAMTHISLGLLSGIETGKHVPNVIFAQRLAQALDTTVEALFPCSSLPPKESDAAVKARSADYR